MHSTIKNIVQGQRQPGSAGGSLGGRKSQSNNNTRRTSDRGEPTGAARGQRQRGQPGQGRPRGEKRRKTPLLGFYLAVFTFLKRPGGQSLPPGLLMRGAGWLAVFWGFQRSQVSLRVILWGEYLSLRRNPPKIPTDRPHIRRVRPLPDGTPLMVLADRPHQRLVTGLSCWGFAGDAPGSLPLGC